MNAAHNLRKQRTLGVVIFCISLVAFFIFLRIVTPASITTANVPAGTPEVVIVTVIDDQVSQTYLDKIKHNREDYASQYGEIDIAMLSLILLC